METENDYRKVILQQSAGNVQNGTGESVYGTNEAKMQKKSLFLPLVVLAKIQGRIRDFKLGGMKLEGRGECRLWRSPRKVLENLKPF